MAATARAIEPTLKDRSGRTGGRATAAGGASQSGAVLVTALPETGAGTAAAGGTLLLIALLSLAILGSVGGAVVLRRRAV